jgi:hypothetical protein
MIGLLNDECHMAGSPAAIGSVFNFTVALLLILDNRCQVSLFRVQAGSRTDLKGR